MADDEWDEGTGSESEEGGGSSADDAGDGGVLLAWPSRIKMLTNPVLWTSMVMVFGISSCFVGALVSFISKSFWGILLAFALFFGFMALVAMIGVVVDLFGGFRVTFTMTTDGVASVAGKEADAIASAAIIGGLLTGNTQAVGTGMLARAGKNSYIRYRDVKKVKVSSWRRYILVKGGFGEQPIGLSCTPENFERAHAILREHCPKAKFVGRSLPV